MALSNKNSTLNNDDFLPSHPQTKKINVLADVVVSRLCDLDCVEMRLLEQAKRASKKTISIPDGSILTAIENRFKSSRKVALVGFEKFYANHCLSRANGVKNKAPKTLCC